MRETEKDCLTLKVVKISGIIYRESILQEVQVRLYEVQTHTL